MSPTEQFLAWYDSLPKDVRETVAFFLADLMPGQALRGHSIGDSVHGLRERLLALAEQSGRANAGLAVAVGALVDFIMIGRSTKEDWSKKKESNKDVVEDALAEGDQDIADTVRRQLEQLPFRSRQWLNAAQTWDSLRNGPLSPTAIHIWLDANLIGSRGQAAPVSLIARAKQDDEEDTD